MRGPEATARTDVGGSPSLMLGNGALCVARTRHRGVGDSDVFARTLHTNWAPYASQTTIEASAPHASPAATPTMGNPRTFYLHPLALAPRLR